MKVALPFNELTVRLLRYVPRNHSGLDFFQTEFPPSFLLSIAVRETEYNVADRPENYKFSLAAAREPPPGAFLTRAQIGHGGF